MAEAWPMRICGRRGARRPCGQGTVGRSISADRPRGIFCASSNASPGGPARDDPRSQDRTSSAFHLARSWRGLPVRAVLPIRQRSQRAGSSVPSLTRRLVAVRRWAPPQTTANRILVTVRPDGLSTIADRPKGGGFSSPHSRSRETRPNPLKPSRTSSGFAIKIARLNDREHHRAVPSPLPEVDTLN
jgi:hypothetical protein